MSDYPWNLDVRPLTTWPGEMTPTDGRRSSPFEASMGNTLSVLTRELNFLNAMHPVLEVAIPREKWRIDGRPRAGAIATHPGVVLSLLKTNVGALRYACDAFYTWQANLRAIALGLEALRRVERYGITKRGEQYAGFKAITAGTTAIGAVNMDRDVALKVISDESGFSIEALATGDETVLRSAIRRAQQATHPDTYKGQGEPWNAVAAAAKALNSTPAERTAP